MMFLLQKSDLFIFIIFVYISLHFHSLKNVNGLVKYSFFFLILRFYKAEGFVRLKIR